MPILNALDFANKNLTVHYRGSLEPQELEIAVETGGPTQFDTAAIVMEIVSAVVNFGGAGSSVFPPTAGKWEVKKAPLPKAKKGPNYKWLVEVAGVAPIYMRTIVEKLRAAGHAAPVKAMRIVGSLPSDRGRNTITEDDVRNWLEDPRAYPEQWVDPGFPLLVRDATNNSVSVTLDVGKPIGPKMNDRLKELFIRWKSATDEYVGVDGQSVHALHQLFPKFANTKTQFRAAIDSFIHVMVPSRNVLINMLSRFHTETAPISATIVM